MLRRKNNAIVSLHYGNKNDSVSFGETGAHQWLGWLVNPYDPPVSAVTAHGFCMGAGNPTLFDKLDVDLLCSYTPVLNTDATGEQQLAAVDLDKVRL
ncbi:hypothetical protein STEG23_022563 [Scotinomys teguina]